VFSPLLIKNHHLKGYSLAFLDIVGLPYRGEAYPAEFVLGTVPLVVWLRTCLFEQDSTVLAYTAHEVQHLNLPHIHRLNRQNRHSRRGSGRRGKVHMKVA
jgi:hypothetical protein